MFCYIRKIYFVCRESVQYGLHCSRLYALVHCLPCEGEYPINYDNQQALWGTLQIPAVSVILGIKRHALLHQITSLSLRIHFFAIAPKLLISWVEFSTFPIVIFLLLSFSSKKKKHYFTASAFNFVLFCQPISLLWAAFIANYERSASIYTSQAFSSSWR